MTRSGAGAPRAAMRVASLADENRLTPCVKSAQGTSPVHSASLAGEASGMRVDPQVASCSRELPGI